MLGGDFWRDISSQLAPDLITAVIPIPSSAVVADGTEKYIIHTSHAQFVLIVANEISPAFVRRGTDRQRDIRALLPALVADPIELPVCEGWTADRSYAVWLRRQPLSANPIIGRIEKLLLAPRVYRWLRDIASHTATSVRTSKLTSNLQKLLEVEELPEPMKIAAAIACDEFLSGNIPSVQVVQHGDLWTGNILKSRSKTGFTVIDWAGAKVDGTPFLDLVSFSLSIGASKSTLQYELSVHSQRFGCNQRHAQAYVLSGLGALFAELEHFPKRRFLDLCERTFNSIQGVASK